MNTVYAIILQFSGAADRIFRDNMKACEISTAIEALDYSGDFIGYYVTRNGMKIEAGE